MRILVVEDDLQMAALYKEWLSTILSSYNFSSPVVVTLISNGIEASQLLSDKNQHFDIVILDQVLPGMSGADIYKKHIDSMKYVVLSSLHMDRFVADIGGLPDPDKCRILFKPFDMRLLKKAIDSILSLEGDNIKYEQKRDSGSKKYVTI